MPETKDNTYTITVVGRKVQLSYYGRLSKDVTEQLYEELIKKYPKYDKWYVVADRRQAKALTPEVAAIIQKSIERAAQNGMKFCVQIVASATIKVQIMRLAKEKGLRDLFFPVTSDEEAREVISTQKKKHRII